MLKISTKNVRKTRKNVNFGYTESVTPFTDTFPIATLCITKSENKSDDWFAYNGKVFASSF